jgi:UDPglucose 6-dehydrogenase
MNIGFIGLGKLGMDCAEVIAQKGHTVNGYDILKKENKYINITNNIHDVVKNQDIVFIAVPTPHDPSYGGELPISNLEPKNFDYSIVKKCLKIVNDYMNKDQILVLISTLLPGTVRSELSKYITNTNFIYNPYLIAMGTIKWDMVNPEMVIIGTKDGDKNSKSINKLVEFYKTIMENNPRYEIGTWEEAECIKIFYNTWITAKISLVNMMQDVANKLGNTNVDNITGALANSSMRIVSSQYMKAGMGDGGDCHPRDNIALMYLADKLDLGYDLFGTLIRAREIQAYNLAKELVKNAKENDMSIYIHGKAYKPKVPYTNGSYSLLVGYYCEKMGYDIRYIDPYTGDNNQPNEPSVFLLAHSPKTTYKYAKGDSENEIYCEIPKNSIIIDPWREYVNKDCKVIYYGNTR